MQIMQVRKIGFDHRTDLISETKFFIENTPRLLVTSVGERQFPKIMTGK